MTWNIEGKHNVYLDLLKSLFLSPVDGLELYPLLLRSASLKFWNHIYVALVSSRQHPSDPDAQRESILAC